MTRISTLRLFVATGLAALIILEGPLSLSRYTSWGLSLPLLLWCAAPFHRGILRALREKRANEDMLLSLGLWAAFALATVVLVIPEEALRDVMRRHWLAVMAALIVLCSLGRWWEERLARRSEEALGRLARRIPRAARALKDGGEAPVPCEELKPGDRVAVKPWETFPADGTVVEGRSHVDESLWTGSQRPVEKSAGSRVTAGTQNKEGELVVSVARAGSRSTVAVLAESVRAGLVAKSGRAAVADSLARTYVPAVVIAATAAALLWAWKGPKPRRVNGFTALTLVLVAACPWTVDLAAPAALAAGIRRARRDGIRIRNPGVLENLKNPDVLLLQKKGMLTEGRPEVSEVLVFGGHEKKDLLRRLAAAEFPSGHPFAEALAKAAGGKEPADARSVETYPGLGVSAVVGERKLLAGSLPWLADQGVTIPEEAARAVQGRPEPLLAAAMDGRFAGIVFFFDRLREGVPGMVTALRDIGVEVALASGDRDAAAHRVAQEAGITRVYAEVFEEQRLRIVERLQQSGKRVVMVGDGFRDAAALSRADLGVAVAASPASGNGQPSDAIGSRIHLAEEAADLILPRGDLAGLAAALRLGLRIRAVIRENLMWAFSVRVLLLPVAAGCFRPAYGLELKPPYLAAAAALSFCGIAFNCWRRLLSGGKT